jgi:hypothetical protein
MLTTIVLSLVVLLLISLSGVLWWSREKALNAVKNLEIEAASLRAHQGSRESMSDTFKGLASNALNEALTQYQSHLAVLEKDRTKTIQSLDGEIKKVVESNLRVEWMGQ